MGIVWQALIQLSGWLFVIAGPVIHLDELACLELLSSFAVVLIPDTVWEEVLHHRPQPIDTC